MSDILKQLEQHLKKQAPDGLPSEWFTKADELKSRAGTLDTLKAEANSCTKCDLCQTRTKVVFGAGLERRPKIAFVGEAPEKEDDLTGEPFVGRAGELLTAAIEKGLKLSREDVYICNVVKCRPPNGREAQAAEVNQCSNYLCSQLELVKPDVIIALGSLAQQALADNGKAKDFSKIRGQWQEWRRIKLMPTFHPNHILKTPEDKKPFWQDLKSVIEYLGL